MPTNKRPRVILCAEMTADGKLLGDMTTVTPPMEDATILPGGADAIRALLEARQVDELRLVVHPCIDGRRDSPSLSGTGMPDFFPASIMCRLLGLEVRGDECVLRYRIVKRRPRGASNR